MAVEIGKKFFAAFAVLAVAVCVAAQPFERYQTVIDRKPFGPEPVNFDPEAAPGSAAANAADAAGGEMTEEQRTAEEQQLAASVRVSMINITPAGAVAVGFTDTSVNPVENYYLKVGRSQNGWTVKSADPATESVTLEKGGVDVTVKLGETSGGKAKGGRAMRGHRPMTLQSRGGPAAEQNPNTEIPADPGMGRAPLGGLARLRQRRAEMQAKAQAEAAKKAQADAVAAAEREEREAREAEEKRAQEEQKAREAEERAQQREALRQIQEQLRKEREARISAQQQEEQGQEAQNDANNVE